MLPDPREKPWVTVDEAVALPGWPLGRTQTYAAVKAGAIGSLRLGRFLVIPTIELWRMANLDPHNGNGAPAEGPATETSATRTTDQADRREPSS